MAKKFTPAPDLKSICHKLITKYPSQFSDVATDRIHFWHDESPKEKKKYAYVRKIDDLSKHLDPEHDFHFVVSRFMVKDFTPGQLHALCCHELKHIGPRDMDKEGNETAKLVAHDFEEFFSIIGAFGADWTFNPNCPDPLVENIEFAYLPQPTKEVEKVKLKIAAKRT